MKQIGSGPARRPAEERDERRLRELLRRAVGRENAPVRLRFGLRRMIRETIESAG